MHAVQIPYTTEDEWRQLRSEGIGASDLAGIIGASPYTTPFSIWAEKIGALPDEPTEAMEWGKIHEKNILDRWERNTGLYAVGRSTLWHHPEHPWARATIDAFAAEFPFKEFDEVVESTALAVVEAKTDSHWTWDEIPLHYQAQGQWQMFVTGLDQVIFPVLHQGSRLRVYELSADFEDQEALFKAADRFWTEYIVGGRAPDVEGSDNEILADVWPHHIEAEKEIPADHVAALARVRVRMDRWGELRDLLEARIKAHLGPAAIGTVAGVKAISWKTQKARRVDLTRLKGMRPDIVEEFTNETESRVLRLHMKETT